MRSDSKSVGVRADRLLGAAAAVTAAASGTGVVGTANTAVADIIHSGNINVVIPDTLDGLYMNLVTGASSGDPLAAPAGWDINPYSASAGTFNLWGASTTTWMFTPPVPPATLGQFVLPLGTVVSAAQSFGRPGGPNNLIPQITFNAPNYFGVQFTNEATNATNFGWVEITFGADSTSRAITEYAFDNMGAAINIGQIAAVPEPSTFALLATGATGLLAMRRRRKLAAQAA